MSSSYPGALDSTVKFPQTVEDDTDSTSGTDLGISSTVGFLATWMRDMGDAQIKVETELGVNPKGLYATDVRNRFEISAYKNQSCACATVQALPAVTYANGTAGVGSTLTANAVGVWAAIDGITITSGMRILVKNQAAGLQNGIYTVTVVGTASVATVLTRAIDADTSAKMADCKVLVDTGTVNGDTEWLCATTSPTMGTTSLAFRRATPIYGHGNPRFPWEIGFTATSAPPVMASQPRMNAVANDTLVLTTATQYMWGGIVVPGGRTVTNINAVWTVAGTAPTVSWWALARQSDRLTMAHTANIVTAPTANVVTTRALTAAWTPTEDTPVWLVLSYAVATTAPQLLASTAGIAAANLLSPALAATNATVPTTTVPTDGTTVIAAAGTGRTQLPYLWLT